MKRNSIFFVKIVGFLDVEDEDPGHAENAENIEATIMYW